MAAAGLGLKIRYGLQQDPTPERAAEWARLVRVFISRGVDKDSAGNLAARQLFADYHTRVYASEGDTIETLLRLAEEKK